MNKNRAELARHNFLARKSDNEIPAEEAGQLILNNQKEFENLYQAARQAEQENALETALSKCEAALEILNQNNIFSDEQQIVEETLESRIRWLLKELRTERNG